MNIEYIEKYNHNEYIHKEIIKIIKSITPKENVKMVICGCKSFTNFLDKNALNEYLSSTNYSLINKIDKTQTTIEICKYKNINLTNFYKSLFNYLVEFVTNNYFLENYFNIFNSSINKNDVIIMDKVNNECIYSINVNSNQTNTKIKLPILKLVENTTDKTIHDNSDVIYYQSLIRFLQNIQKKDKMTDNEIIQIYILLKFIMDGKLTLEYYDALFKLAYSDLVKYLNDLNNIILNVINKINYKVNIKELKKITKLDYKIDMSLINRKVDKQYCKSIVVDKSSKYLFNEDMNKIPNEFTIQEHEKIAKTIDTNCLSNNMNNEILNNLLKLNNLNISSKTMSCVNNLNTNILSINESNNPKVIADKDFVIYIDNVNVLKINKKTQKYNNINIIEGNLLATNFFDKDIIARIHVPKDNKYLLNKNKCYLPLGSEFVLEKINYLYDLTDGIRKIKVITYRYINTLSTIRNIESLINYLFVSENLIPEINIKNDSEYSEINYTLTTSSDDTLTGGEYTISSTNFNTFADDGEDVDFNKSSDKIDAVNDVITKLSEGNINHNVPDSRNTLMPDSMNQVHKNMNMNNVVNKNENIDLYKENNFAKTKIVSTPKTYDDYVRSLINF